MCASNACGCAVVMFGSAQHCPFPGHLLALEKVLITGGLWIKPDLWAHISLEFGVSANNAINAGTPSACLLTPNLLHQQEKNQLQGTCTPFPPLGFNL